MSKFVVARTVYKLTFADAEYEGMVVRVRAMSFGESLRAGFELAWEDDDDLPARKVKQRQMHDMFIEHLLDWNLTDEDEQPIPPTYEGLLSLEANFVGMLVGTWRVGRSAVAAPLDRPSDGGGTSEDVESTLTEIKSESLAS
jgi:hypothetical protein